MYFLLPLRVMYLLTGGQYLWQPYHFWILSRFTGFSEIHLGITLIDLTFHLQTVNRTTQEAPSEGSLTRKIYRNPRDRRWQPTDQV